MCEPHCSGETYTTFYRWPQSKDNWPPPRLIVCRAMTTSPYDSTYRPFVFSPSNRIFGFLSSGLRSVNHDAIDDQIFEHFVWKIGARISPPLIGKWHRAYPFDVSVPQQLFPYKQMMICGPDGTIKWKRKFVCELSYTVHALPWTYSQMDLLICTSLLAAYWRQFLRFVNLPAIAVSLPMTYPTPDPSQLRRQCRIDKIICVRQSRMESNRIWFDRLNWCENSFPFPFSLLRWCTDEHNIKTQTKSMQTKTKTRISRCYGYRQF